MVKRHVVAVFSVAGVFALCAGPASGEDSCGAPGKSPCPLQAWMRTNVAAPLAADDTDGLAAGLAKAAKLSPDATWTSWATFANAGSEAAKKGDVAGARTACKSCHDAWRDAYKAKYRTRPIPK